MAADLATFQELFGKTKFPDEDAIRERLIEARQIHNVRTLATLYCAAHLLTLDAENDEPHDGGSGVVSEEGMGPRRVSYVTQASAEGTARAAFFGTTSYGRRFLALEGGAARARFGAFVS